MPSVACIVRRDGSVFIPLDTPPSWGLDCFYVLNTIDQLADVFDPLRCQCCFDINSLRRSKRIEVELDAPVGLYLGVQIALHAPSGFVVPWEVRLGDRRFASLHVPPWCAHAPGIGQGSVSSAPERVTNSQLEAERQLRSTHVEAAMRSAKTLEHIRTNVTRRMHVFWYERDAIVNESELDSGRALYEMLIARETRDAAHLIEFVDGWYDENGRSWLM
jgi:hypothetical protein